MVHQSRVPHIRAWHFHGQASAHVLLFGGASRAKRAYTWSPHKVGDGSFQQELEHGFL